MNRLKDKYAKEVIPKLIEELGIKNKLAVPRVKKVTVNVGVGDAKDDSGILNGVTAYLAALSGQKPIVTLAKKSIAGFKLSAGAPVGIMVTLRGERMYLFLDKLFGVVLPKVRDFRGLGDNSFDSQGNFNLGLREQLIFPEVDYISRTDSSFAYKTVDKIRGLAVTVVTTAKNKEEGKKLLKYLGMPFMKE